MGGTANRVARRAEPLANFPRPSLENRKRSDKRRRRRPTTDHRFVLHQGARPVLIVDAGLMISARADPTPWLG
jgi:hypothetical protein